MSVPNYIQTALVRIDYAPINSLSDSLPRAVRDAIATEYPKMEFRTINNNNIEIDQEGHVLNREVMKINEWHFNAADSKQRIVITDRSLLLECDGTTYKSFDEFMRRFLLASTAIGQEYPNCTLSRIGLRYVNMVPDYPHGKLCDSYLSDIQSVPESERVRITTTAETKTAHHRMRVLYGLMNPDYPSVDVKKEFLIDLDAYCEGFFYLSELTEITHELHDDIEKKYRSFLIEMDA